MTEYLSLHELSIRASMSERTIRRYLGEIPHHRRTSRNGWKTSGSPS
jgi:DeoR/GlpR family transcriptional regulator of sugar metabolism